MIPQQQKFATRIWKTKRLIRGILRHRNIWLEGGQVFPPNQAAPSWEFYARRRMTFQTRRRSRVSAAVRLWPVAFLSKPKQAINSKRDIVSHFAICILAADCFCRKLKTILKCEQKKRKALNGFLPYPSYMPLSDLVSKILGEMNWSLQRQNMPNMFNSYATELTRSRWYFAKGIDQIQAKTSSSIANQI